MVNLFLPLTALLIVIIVCSVSPTNSQNITFKSYCTPEHINASDGCDCGCNSVSDPDCDPSQPLSMFVVGCEGSPGQPICQNNQCTYAPGPWRVHFNTRISEITRLYSRVSYPLIPVLEVDILDFQRNIFDESGRKVKLVIIEYTASSPPTLYGNTATFKNGVAIFPNFYIVGTAGTFVRLQAETDPPLSPSILNPLIYLTPGDVVRISATFGDLKQESNGFYQTPQSEDISFTILPSDFGFNKISSAEFLSPTFLSGLPIIKEFSCFITKNNNNKLIDYNEYCPTTIPLSDAVTSGVKLNFSEPGDFNMIILYSEKTSQAQGKLISSAYNFTVKPRAETNCYTLNDLSIITKKDIQTFETKLITKQTKNILNSLMFDSSKPRPEILSFRFKRSGIIPNYHTPLAANASYWLIAERPFFVEIDSNFLQAVSLTFLPKTYPEISVELQQNFCGSFNVTLQREIIGHWLYSIVDRRAKFEASPSAFVFDNFTYDPTLVINVPGTDRVCHNNQAGQGFSCCTSYQIGNGTICGQVEISAIGNALITLSILFAIVVSLFITVTTLKIIITNKTLEVDLSFWDTLSATERRNRKFSQFLLVFIAPFILLCSLISIFVTYKTFSTLIVLLIILLVVISLFWWAAGFAHLYATIFTRQPSQLVINCFLVATALMLLTSLYMWCWIFIWVCLGMLVNPVRLSSLFTYFIATLGTYLNKSSKILQTFQLVESTAKRLILKIPEDKLDEILAVFDNSLEGKAMEKQLMEELDMSQEDAEFSATALQKFERFKNRYFLSAVVSTLIFVTLFASFVFVGLVAFAGFDNVANLSATSVIIIGSVFANVSEFAGSVEEEVKKYLRFIFRDKEKHKWIWKDTNGGDDKDNKKGDTKDKKDTKDNKDAKKPDNNAKLSNSSKKGKVTDDPGHDYVRLESL